MGGGEGHAAALVTAVDGGWRATGAEVVVVRRRPITCRFAVDLDARWLTRRVEIHATGAGDERALVLEADAARRWRRNGRRARALDGCIDVDVAATPLTNTFPIRRYSDLRPGQSRTAPVAWVAVPSLRVSRVAQTYTRLGPAGAGGVEAWRYADPQFGGFDLTVDSDGVVVDYEGFAERIAP